MKPPILSLNGVARSYVGRKSNGWGWTRVHALADVSIDIHEGETLAIVGESGSGKSTMAKLLLMLERPNAGHVAWRGHALGEMDGQTRSRYRREVQAVFQNPSSSLNPRMSVEQSLGYIVRRHALATEAEQRDFIQSHLGAVGLNPPQDYLERYPHQLSGGQQQRIAIARAMMLRPRIVIADEPLSSLDVSVQAQVLQLMQELREQTGVGFVIISHDLGAMQAIADRTVVMYRGRIVEIGGDVYRSPAHPYTRLLLDARLSADPRRSRIRATAGAHKPPTASVSPNSGCRFADRCPHAIPLCAQSEPALRPLRADGTLVACHRAEEWRNDDVQMKARPAMSAMPQ